MLLRAVYHYPVICKRSNRGEIEVGGVGCLVVWVGGGARPKNRRWNTWRPDDEGNTPVPLSALDKPPFPLHKSSIFWAFFASSPLFLEFNTWVEDPEVDQLVLVRHTVTMVECDKVPCCFYQAFYIYLSFKSVQFGKPQKWSSGFKNKNLITLVLQNHFTFDLKIFTFFLLLFWSKCWKTSLLAERPLWEIARLSNYEPQTFTKSPPPPSKSNHWSFGTKNNIYRISFGKCGQIFPAKMWILLSKVCLWSKENLQSLSFSQKLQ